VLIIAVTVLYSGAFAFAEEIDKEGSAYCHLSRDFVNNYNVVISTRTDTDNMETVSSVHLVNRRAAGTQSTIIGNTFTTIETDVTMTRLNGQTEFDRGTQYNVDQAIRTASLGSLQYAVRVTHISDASSI
jgi:hypothetical protein